MKLLRLCPTCGLPRLPRPRDRRLPRRCNYQSRVPWRRDRRPRLPRPSGGQRRSRGCLPWRGLGLAQRLGSAPRSRSRVGLRLLLLLVRVLLGPLRRLEWLHLGEHLLLRWLAIETPRRGPPVQPGGFCISAVTAPHLSEPHTCGHRPAPPLPRMYRHGDVWSVLDLNNGDHRRRTVSMRRRDFISLLGGAYP